MPLKLQRKHVNIETSHYFITDAKFEYLKINMYNPYGHIAWSATDPFVYITINTTFLSGVCFSLTVITNNIRELEDRILNLQFWLLTRCIGMLF